MQKLYDDEKTTDKPGQHDRLPMSDEARQAETEGLERQLEGDPAEPAITAADKTELDKLGAGYKQEPERRSVGQRFKSLSRRKKAMFIGGGFGIGAGLGGLGVVMVMLSSFQLIHLGQWLGTDNAHNERASHLRLNAMYRYARSGNFGETRLSYFGSKIFNSTLNDLSSNGVTFQQHAKLGTARWTTIEIDKYPSTQGLSREDAIKKLAGELEIDPDTIKTNAGAGKLVIQNKNVSLKVARNIVKGSVRDLGKGPITSWVKYRQTAKALGIPRAFHPLERANYEIVKRIDATSSAKAYRDTKQAEKQRVQSKLSQNASQVNSLRESLRSKTSGVQAGAGLALLFTGVMCIARDAADEAVAFNRAAVVLPAVTQAIDKQAVGAQQQSGQDFYTEQLGAVAGTLSDADGKTIWGSSALQATRDPTNAKGEDLAVEYRQAFSSDGDANNLKDLGGAVGKTFCSPAGQAIQVVGGAALLALSFPSGGGSLAIYNAAKTTATVGVGFGTMYLISELIKSSLIDDTLADNVDAVTRGGLLAYGSREAANIAARSSGGITLSSVESAALDRETLQESNKQFASRPAMNRLFDVGDYRSLASRMIDSQSTSPSQGLQNFAQSMVDLPNSLANAFASVLPRAQAAQTYDFGFNRSGIPARILDNEAYDDPYENGRLVAQMLDPQDGTTKRYTEKVYSCFGARLVKQDGGWTSVPETDVNPYSSEYENSYCGQDDDLWNRVLLFVNDSGTMEAAACYDGDEQACQNVGMASGGAAADSAPPTDEPVPAANCYTVTKQTGTQIQGRMFHKSGSQTYAFENSPAGIRLAAREGYDSIDLDFRLTKDGVPVATHWERPMVQDDFFDPLGKLPRDTTVQQMTFEEISRLRNRDGQSQILSIDQIAPVLAENKINLSLELKSAALVSKFPEITGVLNTHQVKAYMKADAGQEALNKALAAARNYGYHTRGTLGSQDWKPPGPGCQ